MYSPATSTRTIAIGAIVLIIRSWRVRTGRSGVSPGDSKGGRVVCNGLAVGEAVGDSADVASAEAAGARTANRTNNVLRHSTLRRWGRCEFIGAERNP